MNHKWEAIKNIWHNILVFIGYRSLDKRSKAQKWLDAKLQTDWRNKKNEP